MFFDPIPAGDSDIKFAIGNLKGHILRADDFHLQTFNVYFRPAVAKAGRIVGNLDIGFVQNIHYMPLGVSIR